MRRTKILCTLGPATSDRAAIDALLDAGMDCARLNFSHGSHADHERTAKLVREASAAGRPVGILADLCGPKMRVGRFPGGPIELAEGATFTLTTDDVPGDATRVGVSYERLADDLDPGDLVLLNDGLLRLRVEATTGSDVRCVVEVGGTLSDRKGINLPGARISAPALTDKDKEDLAFATGTLGVDFVALSFVRKGADVSEARQLAGDTPVIAKIEKPEALDRIGEIIDAADGCMVARGDLGVEIGGEKVPLLQKRLIRDVNKAGKLVVTATQMLESMTEHARPTRAEANDVANAVLDGTDAVMLSGETAVGRHPTLAVRTMARIICEVEREAIGEERAGYQRDLELALPEQWSFMNAAARAAALMSNALPLGAIVSFTSTGRAASILSEYRPRAPIVAVTDDERTSRRLALEWGVLPRVGSTTGDAVQQAEELLRAEGLCGDGDAFALLIASPCGGSTNSVQLHRISRRSTH